MPTVSDEETVKKATTIIRNEENEMKFVWLYLKEHESLADNLRSLHHAAPENSVVILISGKKKGCRLQQLSFLLVCVCTLTVNHLCCHRKGSLI